VLLDPDTEQSLVDPQGANYNPAEYAAYLNSGLTAYENHKITLANKQK
jgi:thiol:disulfide interchange protein DsbD